MKQVIIDRTLNADLTQHLGYGRGKSCPLCIKTKMHPSSAPAHRSFRRHRLTSARDYLRCMPDHVKGMPDHGGSAAGHPTG